MGNAAGIVGQEELDRYQRELPRAPHDIAYSELEKICATGIFLSSKIPTARTQYKELVEAAIQNQIRIIPIPGATSVIAALSVSGFKLENFTFYGFFPRKLIERNFLLKKIADSSGPSVLFESGRRLEKLFNSLSEALQPDRRILVARELTKLHETLYRSELYKIKDIILESEFGLKGEFVIIIDGYENQSGEYLIDEEKRILGILMEKLDKKLALQIASEILKKKRNEIYRIKMKN